MSMQESRIATDSTFLHTWKQLCTLLGTTYQAH